MAVITRKSEICDLKLTGREIQTSINVEKYQALAYMTPPYGPLLKQKVEQKWLDWVETIAEAPWINHWVNSPLVEQLVAQSNQSEQSLEAYTPGGELVPTNKCIAHTRGQELFIGKLCLYIFTNATWGFGVEDWLNKPYGMLPKSKIRVNRSLPLMISSILKAQGLKNLPLNRKLLWDPPIYRGCGLQIPPEYGTFDRWLEKLWFEVLEEVALSSKKF